MRRILEINKRLNFIKRLTKESTIKIIKWMFEKKYIYKLDYKIVSEINKYGGVEAWGISGRTNFLLLYAITRAMKPRVVVETGVSSGSSSYVILQALEKNKKGVLYSIDYPEPWSEGQKNYRKKSGWLVPDELKHRWKLLIGQSNVLLPKLLSSLKEIDIFYHDSEHTYENMFFEFNIAWNYLSDGGLLLSDDVTWNNAYIDFCKSIENRPLIIGGNMGFVRKST